MKNRVNCGCVNYGYVLADVPDVIDILLEELKKIKKPSMAHRLFIGII